MLPENNFTIKVVEPSPDVPGTGLFSAGVNNTGSIITIIASVVLLSILAFIVFRFFKKHNNVLKSHNFKRQFKNLFAKRSFVMTMSILTIVTFSLTFVALKNNFGNGVEAKRITNIEGLCDILTEEGGGSCDDYILSVTAEDVGMEVELGDEAVYAETATTVTVDNAATSGYVLYAYAEEPNLYLDGADKNDADAPKISAITTNNEVASLTENTWGVSLSDPIDQTNGSFRGFSNDLENSTLLKVAGAATPVGDSAKFYYGAYLAPGLPYGEYSTTISYVAIANPYLEENNVTVNYHSNGLGNFSNGTDTNTVTYGMSCDMVYVGSNCTSAYRDVEAAKTITLKDIKDNGVAVQSRSYPEGAKTYIYTATVPNAENMQLLIDYDYDPESFALSIIKNGVNIEGWTDSNPLTNYLLRNDYELLDGKTNGTPRVVNVYGDIVTFIATEKAVGAIDNSENTMVANMYSVYEEAPNNKEVVTTSFCDTFRTSNLDDYGTWFGPYSSGLKSDSITIPGADAVTIDYKFAFSGSAGLFGSIIIMGKGQIRGAVLNPGALPTDVYEIDITQNTASEGTITFNGDTVSIFYLVSDGALAEGYDYGLFAKIRPVYDDYQYDADPMLDCSAKAIEGIYGEPNSWKGGWSTEKYGSSEFQDEGQIKDLITLNWENVKGQTIDAYAYNPYSVTYNGNGATIGDMNGFYSVTSEASTLSDYSIDLLAPNFKRDGYGFAGWSLDENAVVNAGYTIYGPNQTITQQEIGAEDFNEDDDRTSNLYAVWVAADDTETMQTFSCGSLSQGEVIALRDERDGNVYTVAKLADGNCWMMENLRLDNGVVISSSNTDNPDASFSELPAPDFTGCNNDDQICINTPAYNNENSISAGEFKNGLLYLSGPGKFNDVINKEIGTAGLGYQWYSYGNFYNWRAATAGTGSYDTGENGEENATGSICPAGWNLPISSDTRDANNNYQDKSFAKLNEKIGSVEGWRAFPNNFIYSGESTALSMGDRGEEGVYSSRTAGDNTTNRVLSVTEDSISTSQPNSKYDAAAIRCVHE